MKPLFATTLTLLALLAAATAQASVDTTLFGGQNYSSVPYAPTVCAGCVSEYANTDTFNTGTTTLSLYAMADYGVLKGSATATGRGVRATASGSATGAVGDNFTIDAAGLAGRQGYFTAAVSMSFTSSYEDQARLSSANLESSIVLNGIESYALQAGYGDAGLIVHAQHNNDEVPPDAPMILTVPFVYGEPIPILMYMDARVRGETGGLPGSFNLVMDAAHSMYWEGISRVTDGLGNAVTGYTLTSDSGTDWTRSFAPAAPVPEPTTAILMLAGLGALGLRRFAL